MHLESMTFNVFNNISTKNGAKLQAEYPKNNMFL